MMSKEMLKQIGIFSVSLGLVASPLAFAANHEEPAPEAKATGSAANPESGGDLASEEDEGMIMDEDETSSSVESTGSAANPKE